MGWLVVGFVVWVGLFGVCLCWYVGFVVVVCCFGFGWLLFCLWFFDCGLVGWFLFLFFVSECYPNERSLPGRAGCLAAHV